jgi:hypothetical protein
VKVELFLQFLQEFSRGLCIFDSVNFVDFICSVGGDIAGMGRGVFVADDGRDVPGLMDGNTMFGPGVKSRAAALFTSSAPPRMELVVEEGALAEVPISFPVVGGAAGSFLLASEGGYGQDAIAAAVSGSSTARRGKRPLRLLERLGELPRVPPTLAGVRQTSVALRRYSS